MLLCGHTVIQTNPQKSDDRIVKMAEKFFDGSEDILFAIIAPSKTCVSIQPQKFKWNKLDNMLLVVTNTRLILGNKTLLSVRIGEVLPQEIKESGFMTLADKNAFYITTSAASLVLNIPDDYSKQLKAAMSKIKGVVSQRSRYAINNAQNVANYFEFPQTDGHGHKLLTVYDMNVTGVMREHDGIDPQTIIPKLHEGEQLLLEADPTNKYDSNAVKVKTINGIQIGWLPQGENLQIDVANRLNRGQVVYARVKKGYLLDNYPGKVGLVIDVARYSKN